MNSQLNALKRYWPLFVLILIAAAATWAVVYRFSPKESGWMPIFMGIFLCQFAMLKLFRPEGFVEGFQKYDWLSQQWLGYAYLYPSIELGLGLSYLVYAWPLLSNLVTIAVMGEGMISVFAALRKGLDVRCACMGTVLDVPLSTVTLTEDIFMIFMAMWMLIH